jgi:two-component system LytT family sensor kinase
MTQSQRWLIGIAALTLLGLLLVAIYFVQSLFTGNPINLLQTLVTELIVCYVWGVAGVGVFYLVRFFPFEKSRLVFSLPVHLACGFAVPFAAFGVTIVLILLVQVGTENLAANVAQQFRTFYLLGIGAAFGLVTYWVIVAGIYAVQYYVRVQAEQRRNQVLQAELSQAELMALKMQIHPHFLFNTLHAISSLLHDDVEAADEMLSRLGDFLRLTLENASGAEQSLRNELDFVTSYLSIEEIRFQDRLTTKIEANADVLDAAIPTLLLQPLVENAVRHGVSNSAKPASIRIAATRHDGRLHVVVEDNGTGLPPDMKEGIGFANTKARLAKRFGTDFKFTLTNKPTGGLLVAIEVPFVSISVSPLNFTPNAAVDSHPHRG